MGPDERMAVLKQNHYDYEDYTVLETVIMGHKRLYEVLKEKDAIYMKRISLTKMVFEQLN